MTTMPETLRWLIMKGRILEAIEVLRRCREAPEDEIEEECRDIANTLGKLLQRAKIVCCTIHSEKENSRATE